MTEFLQTSSEAFPLPAIEEIHLEGTHTAGPQSAEQEWEVTSSQMHPQPRTTSTKQAGLALLQEEDSKILHVQPVHYLRKF